ncbi:girdin-like [Asterias rubens]|uniref:girdin-like n=1 Tax=Asterias rubens TaxID=7604 RepID=UPI0014557C29|nr:girdin-like [Asterias rubens]
MPFHSLLATPPKRIRRFCELRPVNKQSKHSQKYETNLDKELLQHVKEARLYQDVDVASRKGPREGQTPSPSLPYSKDFGTFDLTLCLATDGRCVVLVEYEQRIFVNGRQIYIQDDGQVWDRLGKKNATFQGYYDCAIKAKKHLRRGIGARNTNKSPMKNKNGCYDNSARSPVGGKSVVKHTQPELLEQHCGITFESELTELEAAFGRIIARLCKIILDVIGYETTLANENTDQESSHKTDRLQTTLDRLSDQFQSVVELSASLQAQYESAESIQNMWTSGDGLMEVNQGPLGSEKDDPSESSPNSRRIQDSKIVNKPHELWVENQKLRREVHTLELDLNQLEHLHKQVEKQFYEVESARVDAQNQLASTSAENAALKKQVSRLASGKTVTEGSSSEGSGTNLLSRFAKRLSGSAKLTSPIKATNPSSVESSNEDIDNVEECSEHVTARRDGNGELGELKTLDRHQNLRSEMKRLRKVYENMEDEVEKYGEENRSMRMRLHKMERERDDLRGKLRAADSILEDRNGEIEQLDCTNCHLNTRCTGLSSEKTTLELELSRVNSVCAETGSRLRTVERELKEFEKINKEAEIEKRQCRDKLDLLNQAHLDECSKSSKLLKEKSTVEGHLSRLRREEGALAAELDKLRVENDGNAKGRLRAENENERITQELRDAKKNQAELTDDLNHLRRSLIKSETASKSLDAESAKLREKSNRLNGEAEELRVRSEELYLGNRMLEEENSCMKEMNRKLQYENSEMQETVSSLTDVNTGIRAKMRQWNRDNVSMENKMKKLINAKAALHGVIKQLNTVNSDIENRFEKMDSEYADLEVRLGGKNPNVGDDRGTFEDDFQREYNKLKKQLQNDDRKMTKEERDECPGGAIGEARRKPASDAVANLKSDFAELEREFLRGGRDKIQKDRPSSSNMNDITFVSACSDFDSGELGLWWDDTGELNSSLVLGAEQDKLQRTRQSSD